MTPLSERRGSRAVLIGVAEYTHPEVSNLTAVATNLTDLAQVLTAADGGGFEPKHCVTVTNPDRRRHVGEAISRAGREATDVLLVYYAGHGMLDRRGRLHLALTDSDPDDITWSSVQFDMLREAIVDSGARVRILILDCCFSGRAFEAMSSTSSLVAGQVEISGTYVITSSGANETSFAPAGDRNTAFTAALLTAAAAGPGLTLEEVYRRTDQLLMRNGHPRPKRRSVDVAGEVRLFGSRTDEVELRRAAGTGHVDSMGSLARMLLERGELAEAETWYRRASKAGSTLAMHNLGWLLENRGESAEAEVWWRRAAEDGSDFAMNSLGWMLMERGELAEAETWLRRAAENGTTLAMYSLARMLLERGELAEAETWYRRASKAGSTLAMHNLGWLLENRGESAEAEVWWRRAAEDGSDFAMNSLGCKLMERGELAEAETWLRRAAENGNTLAMYNLGWLLEDRGELAEAETWLRRAAESGEVLAMRHLARTLEQRGESAEAETWHRRAAEAERASGQ